MSDLLAKVRQALAALELVSHAPIQGYDFAPAEGAHRSRWRLSSKNPPEAHAGSHGVKGGDTKIPRGTDVERPGGDPDEREAFRESYHSRTVGFYRRRLRERGPSEALLAEIRETIDAWKRTPAPARGIELERESFYWKCMVADDDRPLEFVTDHYSVSRSTVYRYRAKYRGLRVVPSMPSDKSLS